LPQNSRRMHMTTYSLPAMSRDRRLKFAGLAKMSPELC
jgi:hypothetical protein